MNEAAFLKKMLSPQTPHDAVLVGQGDDAAVVRYGDRSVVLTTDSFIEGRHFDLSYFSPEEVGAKAVEASASDIVAMGARPQYVLWALVLSNPGRPDDWYRRLAAGVEKACARIGTTLIGGNLAKGDGALQLTMTVVGELAGKRAPVLRSGARAGDLVCVSGHLGASAAGLKALQGKVPGFDTVAAIHRNPRCRLDLVDKIGAHATSMIDITDGLSSELHYISSASNVRLVVEAAKIPVHPEARRFAKEQGLEALSLVYGGGEDYEILCTLSPEKAKLVPVTVIGRVEAGSGVAEISSDGTVRELERVGYDHVEESKA